jgi:hypothetical protein
MEGGTMKNPDRDTILATRQRLIESDPFARIINDFLTDESVEFEEFVGNEKTYSRMYHALKAGYWFKRSVWIRKDGLNVWLYKRDPNG